MIRLAIAALATGAVLAGCLDIQSADLFVLTRTGQGQTLTMLVSYGGTITCNGGKSHSLPDPLLLQARDLVGGLRADARAKLNLPSPPGSVFRYRIRLQAGTVMFPDKAASTHPVLARAELFAVQAAAQGCHLPG